MAHCTWGLIASGDKVIEHRGTIPLSLVVVVKLHNLLSGRSLSGRRRSRLLAKKFDYRESSNFRNLVVGVQ